MTDIVVLDTGVLGRLTHPRPSRELRDWLRALLDGGRQVRVPEIADYELRRELIRAGLSDSVERLEMLEAAIGYLPLTTDAMRTAAEFWARARRHGKPMAADPALDADVILAAQAAVLARKGRLVTIATDNVAHLSLFADARLWNEIVPS